MHENKKWHKYNFMHVRENKKYIINKIILIKMIFGWERDDKPYQP
jgi:hypothetical protein